MSMIKYRVHEVAKDFNVTSKVISQILTDYIAPPKTICRCWRIMSLTLSSSI